MKMRKKSELPQKACATCGLPFVWRRKWARDWEQVKYCSDRCRGARSSKAATSADATTPNHNTTNTKHKEAR